MKLKVLEEARQQYLAERAWWVENADHKKLVAREYRDAIRHLLISPESGDHLHAAAGLKHVRCCWLLRAKFR